MPVIIEKNISETVRVIESLFSESFYEVTSSHSTLNKAVVKTQVVDDVIFFEFTKMELTYQDERHRIIYSNNVPLAFSNHSRVIKFNLSECRPTFSVGLSGYTKVNGYLNEFTTNSLGDFGHSFFRAVIVSGTNQALSGFFSHNNLLKIETSTYGSGVLDFTIKNIRLNLFSYPSKESKKTYFVIESQNEVSYSEFISIQDEIVLAITYLTGTFLGKSIYILGSKYKDFDTCYVLSLKHFFDDLKNGYAVIPDVTLQHQVELPPKRFSVIFLERLIHKLLDSLVYKRALLLICQAHTEPAYVMSTLYSVALETITNDIAEEITSELKPIQDKAVARQIRNLLKKSLNDFEGKISDDAYNKICSDIDRINSPTNKQKLLAPFKHFGITLSEKDMAAIEKRNDFLHGRIPEEGDKHYLSLINGRLLFCINCLVLKHIGFVGYVIYPPSIYQFNQNLKIDENPIKEI